MSNWSAGNYVNTSVSQNICKFPASLTGVFISSATGATLAMFDDGGTGTSVTIISAFTPNTTIAYYPMPFQCRNGINAVITGTLTYTVGFD